MIDATLLLPNYNNAGVLPVTFDYLRRNVDCSRLRFVMVDDGSEDDSVAVAKRELARTPFASAEIVEHKHEGIVVALNRGLESCRTEFVLRIDGDATVETPDWDQRICRWLRTFPQIGLVGGQVIFDYGLLHSLGRAVFDVWGLRDFGCWPYEAPGRRTSDAHVVRPAMTFVSGVPYEVDSILGVCVGFRRSDAQAIGGFDQRFSPVWIEDDDFGVQLRRAGLRVVADPAIRVTHRVSLRNSRQPGVTARKALEVPPTAPAKPAPWRRVANRMRRAFVAPPPPSAPAPTPTPAPAPLYVENNPWRTGILQAHYASWRQKWGFDPLNPDLADLHRILADSPTLGWRQTPEFWARSQTLAREFANFD